MADEDFHEKLSVVFTAETAHFATAAQHRIDHLESDLQSSRCESNQPEVCLIIWKRLNSLRYSIDTSPFLKDLLEATAAMHQNAIAIDDEKICNCLREKCHRILPRPTDPTKLFALYRLLSNPLAPVTIQAILAILLFVVLHLLCHCFDLVAEKAWIGKPQNQRQHIRPQFREQVLSDGAGI